MKRMIIIVCATVAVFWNLENFFDFRAGKMGKARFYSKCEGIAKEMFRIADRYGRLPDIIAVAEVENSFVLRQLVSSSLMRKGDYGIVHYDSPDHRGIDCGLLYRKSSLQKLGSKPCHIYDTAGRVMKTRDILLVNFRTEEGWRLDVLVNHHPSKFGGKSDEGRNAAMRRMVEIKDSLAVHGGTFLSFGDFNETPGYCPEGMKDLSAPLALKGRGTIRFNGSWELIDRCFVADTTVAEMEIWEDSILQMKDSAHGGMKPRRTFSGPRYLGGISDHYPIVVVL